MSTICQHLYTFGEEVKFTRMWEDCGGVSDCEELVGVSWRLSDCEEVYKDCMIVKLVQL